MNETSYMITRERAVEILREDLPAWVQDLGLVVGEVGGFHASLRLPWNLNHSRDGKQVSTSALVAAADSAAMVAVCSARGGYLPMTAIQQSTSFFHPVLNQDVLVRAGVTRLDEDTWWSRRRPRPSPRLVRSSSNGRLGLGQAPGLRPRRDAVAAAEDGSPPATPVRPRQHHRLRFHPGHPLGCHRRRISDRIVFDKMLQLLRFGCSYEAIADTTCSATTIRSWRDEWIHLGVFAQFKRIALESYDRIVGLVLDRSSALSWTGSLWTAASPRRLAVVRWRGVPQSTAANRA